MDDEILDDAVEDDVVVVAASRELDEVPAGLRRVLVVHLDGEGAHGGLEGDLRRAAVSTGPHARHGEAEGGGAEGRGEARGTQSTGGIWGYLTSGSVTKTPSNLGYIT